MQGRDEMRRWGMNAQTAKAVGSRLWNIAVAVDKARETGSAPTFVIETEDVDFEYLVEKLPPHLPQPGLLGRACSAALELARATPSLTAALAQTMLGPLRHELARHKREVGQYDFDDMLTLVDEALRGPRGGALVAALRERWGYALIDEFQDTDETQWSIFRRAFFEPHPGAKSVVCLVGDPKQSIYRFRGADVETYLRARDDVGRSGGEPVLLDTNYRATAALVDATNAIFDASAASPFFTGNVRYQPVTCGRAGRVLVDADGRSPPPLHAFRFDGDMSMPVLAARIAREIRRDHGRRTPVAPRRRAARAAGRVRPDADGHGGADGRRRAAGGRRPARVLQGRGPVPDRRGARDPHAARSPSTNPATARAASPRGSPPSSRCRWKRWSARESSRRRIRTWRGCRPGRRWRMHATSSASSTTYVCESGILRREIFFAEGERELTNYLHVFELLLEHARRTRATLRDLVHALSGLIDKTRLPLDLEGNVQRLESERRAVQIMTIHKAKGLEAARRLPRGRLVRLERQGGPRLSRRTTPASPGWASPRAA